MTDLLLPLLFLACPLMMIFMMRGMHSGKNATPAVHDPQQARNEGQLPESVSADALAVDARIAELERQFTSVRDVPDRRRSDR